MLFSNKKSDRWNGAEKQSHHNDTQKAQGLEKEGSQRQRQEENAELALRKRGTQESFLHNQYNKGLSKC